MKKIEPSTLYEFKFVSNPQISPDGKKAAFTVKYALKEENKYKSEIHLLDLKTKETKLLTDTFVNGSFIWQKDGSLLFPSARNEKIRERMGKGEMLTSFYTLSLNGEEAEEAFTLPLSVEKIKETEEGKYLFTALYDFDYPDLSLLSDNEKEEALKKYSNPPYEVIDEFPFWENGAGFTSRKRNRLYLYDRVKNEIKPLTGEKFYVAAWEEKFGKVIYTGGEYEKERFLKEGIYVLDLATGKNLCVAEPDIWKTEGFGFIDENRFFIAASKGEKYGYDEYNDFYIADANTGKMKKICHNENTVGYSVVGSDARLGGGRTFKVYDKKAYYVTTVDESAYLRCVDENGHMQDVFSKTGSVDCFDIGQNGNIIIEGMFGNHLTELYDGEGNTLTHINDGFYKEHEIITPEMCSFTASDGYEIRGYALKPKNFEKGKKYPAILDIHGGPRCVFGDIFNQEMQMWADEGYFVIFCNPRGSCGRGSDFADLYRKYGRVDYDNLMEFTDFMIKKYPEIDENRMGVAGGSYGGFMTNWIIGHTDRFKAAASQRSIANWISVELTTDSGYICTEYQLGATTKTDVNFMWDSSPLKYADKVKTPTLFIHSDNDYRCWMAEGLSMFTALKLHGVESRLCLFKGENHELSRSGRPYNRVRRMEEILSWMDKHLKEEK